MGERDELIALACAALASRGVTVDRAAFTAHVLRRGQVPPHLEELALAFASLHADPRAIELFERDYFPHAERALRRMNADQTLRDDVISWMRGELFVRPQGGLLSSYSGRGDLAGWLRSVATREALKRLERAKKEVPADALEELPLPASELAFLRGGHAEQFTRAFNDAFASLSTEQRNLLRQHFLDGLSIDVLARLYDVHRATAARRLVAARTALVDAVRTRLKAELGYSTGGVDEVITLSNLNESIEVLLKKTRG